MCILNTFHLLIRAKDYAEQEAAYSKKKKDKKDKYVCLILLFLQCLIVILRLQKKTQAKGHWLLHGQFAESLFHQGEWNRQGVQAQGKEGQEVKAQLQQLPQRL